MAIKTVWQTVRQTEGLSQDFEVNLYSGALLKGDQFETSLYERKRAVNYVVNIFKGIMVLRRINRDIFRFD